MPLDHGLFFSCFIFAHCRLDARSLQHAIPLNRVKKKTAATGCVAVDAV